MAFVAAGCDSTPTTTTQSTRPASMQQFISPESKVMTEEYRRAVTDQMVTKGADRTEAEAFTRTLNDCNRCITLQTCVSAASRSRSPCTEFLKLRNRGQTPHPAPKPTAPWDDEQHSPISAGSEAKGKAWRIPDFSAPVPLSSRAACREGKTQVSISRQDAEPVKYREIIQIIEADGWVRITTRGSHRQYRHPVREGTRDHRGKTESRRWPVHAEEHPEASGPGPIAS